MTLMVVEDAAGKQAAQKTLQDLVKARLQRVGMWNIGFPSGNVDETIYSNGDGELWAAFSNANDAQVPRRWNAFGVYDGKRHAQMITVEINIRLRPTRLPSLGYSPATW